MWDGGLESKDEYGNNIEQHMCSLSRLSSYMCPQCLTARSFFLMALPVSFDPYMIEKVHDITP